MVDTWGRIFREGCVSVEEQQASCRRSVFGCRVVVLFREAFAERLGDFLGGSFRGISGARGGTFSGGGY